MRRFAVVASGLCALLSSSVVFAADPMPSQPSPSSASSPLPVGRDAATEASDAYCNYVRSVSQSQSAPMISPQVFATGGFMTGADSATGPTTTTVQPRVIAGVQYSIAGLNRGIQTKELAEADCTRMRVFNKLYAYSIAHVGGESAPALQAKLTVLESANSRSNEILQRVREGVEQGRMTVDELNATIARVDVIRSATTETRGRLRIASGAMQAPKESVAELFDQRDKAERAAEERAAKVRQSQSWDVSVRGGYDQIFGQNQVVPLFGMVTVSFNPGLFWQRPADARAENARVEMARTALEQASVRANDTARMLREKARADRERLAEISPLLAELEKQEQQIRQLQTDHARVIADGLWFSSVTLRAEYAYLDARATDLAKAAGGVP